MPETDWKERVLQEFKREVLLRHVGNGELHDRLYRGLEETLQEYGTPRKEDQRRILFAYGRELRALYGEGESGHRADIERGITNILDMQAYLAGIEGKVPEEPEETPYTPRARNTPEPKENTQPTRAPFGGPIEETDKGYTVGIGEHASGFRRGSAACEMVGHLYRYGDATVSELESIAKRRGVTSYSISMTMHTVRNALKKDPEWKLTIEHEGRKTVAYAIDRREPPIT